MHTATTASIQPSSRDILAGELHGFLRRQILAELRANRSPNPYTFRLNACTVPNRNECFICLWLYSSHGVIWHVYPANLDRIYVHSRSSLRAAHHEHRERETS